MQDDRPMTKQEMQMMSMALVWFGAVILLAALFIAAGLQGAFALPHYIFAGIILTLALFGTGGVIYWMRNSSDVDKAKRQRIDAMLRDMSDDDLMALKQRLSDGDVTEESLLEYVSDDGELVFRS